MSNDSANKGKSGFGGQLMSYISERLPYNYKVVDSMDEKNPKYDTFEKAGLRRTELLAKHSVSLSNDYNDQGLSSIERDNSLQKVLYANIQQDKHARLRDYRTMAAFSDVADAMDEICDECINKDENGAIVTLEVGSKNLTDKQKSALEDEFQKIATYFDLENKGWTYIRQFLIEGELFFENIVHEDYPTEGILGVVNLPSELIDPVYNNIQNLTVKGFVYRKPIFDPSKPQAIQKYDFVPLSENQIVYVNSGIFNDNKMFVLPILENARRAYRQLSLIEDAIVIYRMVRAPERLVFNVDVGNMAPPKAESYLRKLIQQYWSSKSFDANQNDVVNKFNPQSMLDAYWFAKRQGSEGTSVTQLAGGCLAMDTLVPLLDGRKLTIREIEEELKQKEVWVYSCDPVTGEHAPGLVTWAGVTQKSAEVYKITFDNGKDLICTPDHKFPIINKGFVEAKDLVVGESMIPFNNQLDKLGKQDYEMVYNNKSKTWEYTHRVVAKFFKDKGIHNEHTHLEVNRDLPKNVIHHKDFNRFNNNPDNLLFMNGKDHILLHRDQKFTPLVGTIAAKLKMQKMRAEDPAAYQELRDRITTTCKNTWVNMSIERKIQHSKTHSEAATAYINELTEEGRCIRAKTSKDNRYTGNRKLNEKLKSDTDFNKFYGSQISRGLKNKFNSMTVVERKEHFAKSTENKRKNVNYTKNIENHSKKQTIMYDNTILKFVIDQIKGKTTHEVTKHDVVAAINDNNQLSQHFIDLNKNQVIRNWDGQKFSYTHLVGLARQFGYKDWNHLRRQHELFNHRIVSIEKLQDKIEVGTLTIDDKEQYHNYHTFALDCGVYTKNSNLGELSDLMYFIKKLYRSLKVPTSRLDPDDGFKDGTDILREELKFARFIIRMQQRVAAGIKRCFITHLKLKKVWDDLDITDFDLNVEFNVPTNFYDLRENQKLEIKAANFSNLASNEYISNTFAQKKYLSWNDTDILANREYLRKDAELAWELEQIKAAGPDWKTAGAETGLEPAGGGTAASGGGGGVPPPFGGGEAPPEGEAPAEGGVRAGEETPPEAPPAAPASA